MVIIGTPNDAPQNPDPNNNYNAQNNALNTPGTPYQGSGVVATPDGMIPEPPVCVNPDEPPPPNLTPLACANTQEIAAEEGLIMLLEQGTTISQEQTAPISSVNGTSVFARQRAISLVQGQAATVVWQLQDRNGVPLDLSPLVQDESLKVVLRLKEQIGLNNNNKPPHEIDMELVMPAAGKVSGQLTAEMTNYPGVYYGEVALISTATEYPAVIFVNVFSLVIARGTFGVGVPGGPPSIAEIRLHLRDSSPAESFLLDNLMFDDAEIALAVARPVMYWNETPPPIQEFDTQTFPFRYHWLEGICANLFFMVAEQFRRNQLDYAAAGVTVNDQNKEANYERAGQTRWQAYREWVRAKKAQLNLEGCYGQIGSVYQYGVYSSGIRSRY